MRRSARPWLGVLFAAPVVLIAATARGDAVHGYVGSRRCGACHPRELESWKGTRMANAFHLLEPGAVAAAKLQHALDPEKDYTKDAACLPCHSTGFGRRGGFVDHDATPDLDGIGCEVCHGPGEEYVKRLMAADRHDFSTGEAVDAGLVVDITKERCAGCHNAKSPTVATVGTRHFVKEFVFEERIARGVHAKFPLRYRH